MKPENIITGCSSYNTASWKGLFYPEDIPKSKWFQYYCEHFSTYELNSTFYKFPTVKTLQNWYNKTPGEFLFSAKAFKGITHYKKFSNCTQEIADLYGTLSEGLAEKLACVLFQLPPSFSYSEERLALIIESLDFSFKNVVEFRHESWWRQDVAEALANAGITFCSVNYPKLPTDIIATTSTGYVRMHGNPKLFYSKYSEGDLQDLHKKLLAHNFHEAFVYFNNTASEAAIENAIYFKEMH
ncbi:DUF72 domain-containing protein [Flavobacterium sp. MFBS3-15]|uniref:DUF72 domain-containing protein n=1 Tax=Flavobacterium sp. MFBS3-15 TaxID=2989816 RepID=UPI002235D08D|nr:DUF72 domain-containing protein [Flavobacterium sp. MFBS3-15]MCW4470531.1 DUF72 domain-containing protein [Flavobacterium sp. MFBS3-15]